ncbi:MAG: hypothetical protein QE278_09245 [Limnobacter sp.]|nr:hypothetical protein [Limnobacter sp.]
MSNIPVNNVEDSSENPVIQQSDGASTNPLVRVRNLAKALDNDEFATTTELVHRFRQEKALIAELPSVFEGALEGILERLESTAMFNEEACSFSQTDMFAALSVWVEKAESYLLKQLGVNLD